MGRAAQPRVFLLLAGVYLVLIVECFSLGFVSHATLAEVLDHSEIDVHRRSTSVVIILTLLAAVLIGYIGTLPFLCYAVQRRRANALVPYLIWRAFLCILVISFVIWQTILGAVFFGVVFLAYREFTVVEAEKDRSPERDAVA